MSMKSFHTYIFGGDGNMAYAEWPDLETAQNKVKILANHPSTIERMFIISDIQLTFQAENVIASLCVTNTIKEL